MMDATLATSPQPSPPIEAPETVLLHNGMSVQTVFLTYATGAVFPLTAGLALFGWRALIVVGTVVLTAMATAVVWRRIGLRGGQIRVAHMLWLSIVLGLMLPAHLASRPEDAPLHYWPILPAAGVTLVILNWLLGGLGVGRVHPVLATYLVIVALFGSSLVPSNVLQRNSLFGDVLDTGRGAPLVPSNEPWISRPIVPGQAALRLPLAAEQLHQYTRGNEESWVSMDAMVRDRMPPLQDLIIAGQPAPVGMGSIVAILIGGLFLLYRGLIDFRIPLLITISLMIALYILPVPIVIADKADWRWLAIRNPHVGWPTVMTFVHYEMLASPVFFMAMFLATDPSVRPMAKHSRAVYAIVIGILAAIGQRYVSVSVGPFIALLAGSLLTPFLDKALRPKPLV
jgi:electron transport complex protein RnfD